MSNIYSKVVIEKNSRSQNFDFASSKICLPVSLWGASAHADVIEFYIFLLQLKNKWSETKSVTFLLFSL